MADEPGIWPNLQRVLGIPIIRSTASVTERNVARTGIALIFSGLVGLVLVFAYGQPTSWSVAVTSVIVAAAALSSGFLLGFLFGIPRSRRQEEAPTSMSASTASPISSATTESRVPSVPGRPGQTTVTAVASSPNRLTVNANLEEISDWLTKIIVGVGLIELNNIPDNLDRLARYVAAGLLPTSTSTPPVTFALAIIVYFSVLGFLSGYLLTRLFLAGAFSAADEALNRLREDLENKSEEVERQKERVNQVIEGADQSARTKEIALAPSVEAPVPSGEPEVPAAVRLARLEERYKSIRESQLASEERTRQMTSVVSEMQSLVSQLKDFDFAGALKSPRREERLGAYALIYAQPKPDYLAGLVDSIVAYTAEVKTDFDNRPFGEYWGIQALDKVLSVSKMPVDPGVVRKLMAWASRLPKGTDRWFEMLRIFRRYGISDSL
jgi:hypothetical protein